MDQSSSKGEQQVGEHLHQLRSVNIEWMTVALQGGGVTNMLILRVGTYLERPGQPPEMSQLPGLAMSVDTALGLAETLRAHAMQRLAPAPPSTPSPGQTLN